MKIPRRQTLHLTAAAAALPIISRAAIAQTYPERPVRIVVARAFEHFFGVRSQRALPEGLTPGDFATVRRKQELLGSAKACMLLEWLEQEVEAKGLRPAVGFIAPRLAIGGRG
jgi:hypothetical protein